MNPILDTQAGKYVWHDQWLKVPAPASGHEGRTHGIVVTKSGEIVVFHQAVPAVAIYSAEGRLLRSWGDYAGAHGVTLVEEEGVEYLWLTDERTCIAEKLTLDGKVIQSLSKPFHSAYESGRYVPTWVAVNEVRHGGNGDIWVTDGYGSHLVHRYNAAGAYLQTIDGTEGGGRFDCPHGILFDPHKKEGELYIADRGNHRVQVYSADGKFKRIFGADFLTSPDGFAFFRDQLVIPELKGRITIVDAQDRFVAYLGDNEPICVVPGWPDQTPLEPVKFNSPHAAAVDAEGNILVAEWRKGGRITKLEKL